MGIVETTTCVYQFIYDENENYFTKIIQYFIMHRIGLWIKVDSYVAYMFYLWSFIHNTSFPIAIKKLKEIYFLEYKHFCISWEAGNYNKVYLNN